jgi:replicative DNA helicase
MSLYKKVLEKLIKNKELKNKGEYLGIPYPFQRLNEYVGTIDKSQVIGILGGTGVAKSKFCRNVFIYHCYNFYKQTGYR